MAGGRPGGGDSVPHNAKIAFLIIDMISDFEFEGGDRLLRGALPAARGIAQLKRARAAKVPVFTSTTTLVSGARTFANS